MKLTIIFLLLAFKVSAQDSVKINVNVQARDVELITALLPYDIEYEDAYDAAKKKFRVANAPSGNTNVAIDSVMVSTWLKLWTVLQRNPYAVAASAASRVDAVLRAKNNEWLTGKMDAVIADGTAHYGNLRVLGRKRLKGK